MFPCAYRGRGGEHGPERVVDVPAEGGLDVTPTPEGERGPQVHGEQTEGGLYQLHLDCNEMGSISGMSSVINLTLTLSFHLTSDVVHILIKRKTEM